MKKLDLFFFILMFIILTVSYIPVQPSFGGKILVKNASSYNLLVVFEIIPETIYENEVLFLIEKNEEITIYHTFHGENNRNWRSDPTVYYMNIIFYDLENGDFINKINFNNNNFKIIEGNIKNNNAIFYLTIDDNIIGKKI